MTVPNFLYRFLLNGVGAAGLLAVTGLDASPAPASSPPPPSICCCLLSVEATRAQPCRAARRCLLASLAAGLEMGGAPCCRSRQPVGVPPPAERPSCEPGSLRCRCGAPVCDAGRPWPLAASPKGQNGPENGPFWPDGPAKQSCMPWPSSTSRTRLSPRWPPPLAHTLLVGRTAGELGVTGGARRRAPRAAAQAHPIGRSAYVCCKS